ncbi:MAG: TetR family transcriptional regulator [Woeseiaceae bacterium]|nr:TetR family transcriptional regulator [Woeseiaceae bacterium]
MTEPKFQRRKEDRPQEITEAAFDAFAEKGYAATRVNDVARRAGVSKGLLYLYFKTKEELFKAVVRSVVIPRLDALITAVERSDKTSEEFLRGPFLDFAKTVPGSPMAVVIRLLIAEGRKHPDLLDFYYDNVISRGHDAIAAFLERGVQSGEFRRSAVTESPYLFIMPVIFSVILNTLLAERSPDTGKLIETQLDLLIAHMKGVVS